MTTNFAALNINARFAFPATGIEAIKNGASTAVIIGGNYSMVVRVEDVEPVVPSVQPLWFYRMVPGVSMSIGSVIINGRTFYGPTNPFTR